jgi:uncharacterized protein YcgI (DUF1989 family)
LEVIMTEVLIPARQGRAVRVASGAAIDVINTHGTQDPADVHFRVLDHG